MCDSLVAGDEAHLGIINKHTHSFSLMRTQDWIETYELLPTESVQHVLASGVSPLIIMHTAHLQQPYVCTHI